MKKRSSGAVAAIIAGLVAGLVAAVVLAWPVLVPAPEVAVPRSASSTHYGVINQEQLTLTATGAAGSATGSQVSSNPVRGHMYAVHLDYAAGISSTTDITLATQNAPVVTIMTISNNATDGWYYPAVEQTSNVGAGLSVYDRPPMADYLSVSAAQTTSSTSVVTVTVLWGN
jgi:hypothetical protein